MLGVASNITLGSTNQGEKRTFRKSKLILELITLFGKKNRKAQRLKLCYFNYLVKCWIETTTIIQPVIRLNARNICYAIRWPRGPYGEKLCPRVILKTSSTIRPDQSRWITFLFFFLLKFEIFWEISLQPPPYVCCGRIRVDEARDWLQNQTNKTLQHDF